MIGGESPRRLSHVEQVVQLGPQLLVVARTCDRRHHLVHDILIMLFVLSFVIDVGRGFRDIDRMTGVHSSRDSHSHRYLFEVLNSCRVGNSGQRDCRIPHSWLQCATSLPFQGLVGLASVQVVLSMSRRRLVLNVKASRRRGFHPIPRQGILERHP